MTHKVLSKCSYVLLILLSGCSYAYTARTDGEWVGDPAKLKEATAQCIGEAEEYMADEGIGRGFGGNSIAHGKMERCMKRNGFAWRQSRD